MPAVNSKNQICNLANGSLGIKNSINSIDTPKSDKEVVYAMWYDITRQYLLKTLMPNFALNRLNVGAVTIPPAYTNYYAYAYEYPVRCLKLLGLGPIDCVKDPPTVENGIIFTNQVFNNGIGPAPIRFVDDISDVTKFTPDFVFAFVSVLAKCTALSTTQDPGKKQSMLKDALEAFINTTAQNAQENKPIRVSTSRFRTARNSRFGGGRDKQ